MRAKRILITGASGYLGFQLAERLCQKFAVVGFDIRGRNDAHFPLHIIDIRSAKIGALMVQEQITHVIHMACVVEPTHHIARDYDIDVNGTRNLLKACVNANIKHITVISSGAAYGYHADNPAWLVETDRLRGNSDFSYSNHKRLVEELLADYRKTQPQFKQLIFRPGTVLGANTNNMITRLFSGKWLLAISGSATPFVFIWDEDVVNAIEYGVSGDKNGIYNMAGDGALSMREIAKLLDKPLLQLPAWLIKMTLFIARSLRLTRYGPEQINFLRYRPVLQNKALKQQFGYTPTKSSLQTFQYFISQQQ